MAVRARPGLDGIRDGVGLRTSQLNGCEEEAVVSASQQRRRGVEDWALLVCKKKRNRLN